MEEIKQSLNSKGCKCPRILVTDDDPFNHMALEGLFMMQGIMGIDRAYNGKEALEKVEAN
jgi:CheY-like chemotaxis protein